MEVKEKKGLLDTKLNLKQVGGVVGLAALIPFFQYMDTKYVQQVQFKNTNQQIVENAKRIDNLSEDFKDEIKDIRHQTSVEIEEVKDIISKGFQENNSRLIRIEDLALDRNKSLERRIEKLEEKSK